MIDIVEIAWEERIPQLLRELKQLQDELNPRILQLTQELADLQFPLGELEREIKEEVLKRGASVKTPFADATYVSGGTRVSWDSRELDGYAVAHPEVKVFRKESQTVAYVRIKVK